MSLLSAIPFIGKFLDGAFGIIDKAVLDKDQAAQLKANLKMEMMGDQHDEIQALLDSKTKIILAEANGGFLQRNWRPMLMLIFMVIIANNYIVFPYISLFWPGSSVMLELPVFMWDLLKIGVGGYVVGRSVEKGISTWKNGQGQ